MSDIRELYRRWTAADAAWTAAIKHAFPGRWPGDVRYQPAGEGEPNTALRAAYIERQEAQHAFYAAGGARVLMGQIKEPLA